MSSRVSGILRMARAASTRRKLGVRYASKALPSACPSCSAPLPTPLPACPKCSFISPVSLEVPKHELFGIDYEPNPFIIDTSALRHKFRELQRVVHPDVWSGSDKVHLCVSLVLRLRLLKAQQDVAVNLSAYVNESFKTLLAPVPRAEYILSRNGIHLSETDNLDDSELIMEIMDAREGLEEASSRDEADSILAGVEGKDLSLFSVSQNIASCKIDQFAC
jgi:molecular chaperone HscB